MQINSKIRSQTAGWTCLVCFEINSKPASLVYMSTTRDQALKERILSEIRRLAPEGSAPSRESFLKATGLKEHQLDKFWSKYSDAVKEAGLTPNAFGFEPISRDTLLRFLAVLTRELGQFPTFRQMKVAKSKSQEFPSSTTFVERLGLKDEMIQALLEWTNDRNEFIDVAAILAATPKAQIAQVPNRRGNVSNNVSASAGMVLSNSFLPPIVECLAEIARGSTDAHIACEELGISINTEFEKRVMAAFELLGLEVKKLGQGLGRNPDGIAKCVGERSWAIIYDAKVRESGYRMSADDERAFREYIEHNGERLRDQGIFKYYFAVISSSFVERDIPKARELCRQTNAKACILLEADALIQLVEKRLSCPRKFTMDSLERLLTETRILSVNDDCM